MLAIKDNFHTTLYEQFHANWEILIREIKPLDKPMSVLEFYGIKARPTDQTPILKFSPKEEIVHLKNQNLSMEDLNPHFIAMPYHTNTLGYHFSIPEHRPNDLLPVVLAYQTKISHGDSNTSLSMPNVVSGWNRTKEELKSIPEQQLFFIVCAYRDATTELATLHTEIRTFKEMDPEKSKKLSEEEKKERYDKFKEKLAKMEEMKRSILVLNQEKLRELYTETLSCRPQFFLTLHLQAFMVWVSSP